MIAFKEWVWKEYGVFRRIFSVRFVMFIWVGSFLECVFLSEEWKGWSETEMKVYSHVENIFS